MSKYVFYALYIALLLCNLIYSNFMLVGPLTYRHVIAMLLLLYLVLDKGSSLKMDKYFSVFMVYVLFWGISSVTTGYIDSYLSKFFGTTLIAYTVYQSTKLLITKYDAFHVLIIVLLTIGLVDSAVTILQFFNNPLGYMIPGLMRVDFIEEYEGFAMRKFDAGNSSIVIPGIIGGALHGYLSSCLAVLALYPFNGKIRIVNILLWVVFFISLFFVQERSSLLLGFLGSIYVYYYSTKNNHMNSNSRWMNVVLSVVIIYVIYKIVIFATTTGTRYTDQGLDDGGRSIYIDNALNYLAGNLLGGYFEYSATGAMPPHNLFINALLWGGVFGGSVLIVMLLRQIWQAVKVLITEMKYLPAQCVFFGMLFLVYTGNSLLHNESVVTGSSTPWLYWAMFITYYEKYKYKSI